MKEFFCLDCCKRVKHTHGVFGDCDQIIKLSDPTSAWMRFYCWWLSCNISGNLGYGAAIIINALVMRHVDWPEMHRLIETMGFLAIAYFIFLGRRK